MTGLGLSRPQSFRGIPSTPCVMFVSQSLEAAWIALLSLLTRRLPFPTLCDSPAEVAHSRPTCRPFTLIPEPGTSTSSPSQPTCRCVCISLLSARNTTAPYSSGSLRSAHTCAFVFLASLRATPGVHLGCCRAPQNTLAWAYLEGPSQPVLEGHHSVRVGRYPAWPPSSCTLFSDARRVPTKLTGSCWLL